MSLQPHLDDEVLSAVLDGEATPDESAHADACDECGARLAALRDASLLVRTPVEPVGDATRESAIAAALAAAESSNVVPMRRRRGAPPAWLAAAAAVVVAVGAVGLLVSRTGGDDEIDFATGGQDASATTTADLAESGGAGGDEEMATFDVAAPAPAAGGDLGELAGADLRNVIDTAMAQREVAETEEATDADSAAGSSAAATAGVPCEPETRATNAELGPLVFTGTGTYEGDEVIVLAFDVGPDRWVYVLDLDGCAIRNQQTYSP